MKDRIDVLWNFFKLYHCGVVRLLVIDLLFDLVLVKERGLAQLREIVGFVARYPERSGFRIYVGKGVVYVWLSWSSEPPKSYPV